MSTLNISDRGDNPSTILTTCGRGTRYREVNTLASEHLVFLAR